MDSKAAKFKLNALRALKNVFPEIRNKFPEIIGTIGSSLLGKNPKSDYDIVVGNLPNPRMFLHSLTNYLDSLLKQREIGGETYSSSKFLGTQYLGLENETMVGRVIAGVNYTTKQMTLVGPKTHTITMTLVVIDVIFANVRELPVCLFTKGALIKLEGLPRVSSRHPSLDVADIRAEAKDKKTSLVKIRVDELLSSSKFTLNQRLQGSRRQYLLQKILSCLLRGWNITNTTLSCSIPPKYIEQYEDAWLMMLDIPKYKEYMQKLMTPHIKFFVTDGKKKFQVDTSYVLAGKLWRDNESFWCLPDGKLVPAFTWQNKWKKLDPECVCCNDDTKEAKVVWRTAHCPHVICDTCHDMAQKHADSYYEDGLGGRYQTRHDFSKVCSLCKNYTLFPEKCSSVRE